MASFLPTDTDHHIIGPNCDGMPSSQCNGERSGPPAQQSGKLRRRKWTCVALIFGVLGSAPGVSSVTLDESLDAPGSPSHSLLRKHSIGSSDSQVFKGITEEPYHAQLEVHQNALELPTNRLLERQVAISRSYAISLYKSFCPAYEYGSLTTSDCRKANGGGVTTLAIAWCKTVHSLSQPRIVNATGKATVFRYTGSREGRKYKVLVTCLNGLQDDTCFMQGLNCLPLCTDCSSTWLCRRKRPVCGCALGSCLNSTVQPAPVCNNCTDALRNRKPPYIMQRPYAINFYKQFCPSFDATDDAKKHLCGAGGVETQTLERCGKTHRLSRRRPVSFTAETTYFSYIATRSKREYGVTISCPTDDPTNSTCDITGLNCLDTCHACNTSWLCPDAKPVCGCTPNMCLSASHPKQTCNAAVDCFASHNSTNTTTITTNSTKSPSFQIPRNETARIYQDFCPAFQWNTTNRTCGTGGVAIRTFNWCGSAHTLSKTKDMAVTSNGTYFYYNASRSGLQYNIVFSCRSATASNSTCDIQGLNCLGTCSSCNTTWLCPEAQPVCGCSPRTCFTNSTAIPLCNSTTSCRFNTTNITQITNSTNATNKTNATIPSGVTQPRTMTQVNWDSGNAATIEFCQLGNNTFGYRLPGEPTCGPAGVLIRVDTSKNYKLTLRNNSTQPTNLIVQGLHVSGDGNANNVDRQVDPGSCITYYYNIRSDQMGGIFLMHSSNRNGTASQQVDGGAFGVFIVKASTALLSGVNSTARTDIKAWSDRQRIMVVSKTRAGKVFGNGRTDNVQSIVLGEWYRFRFVAVDVTGSRNNLDLPSSCDSYAVAHDGVWRFLVPQLNNTRSYSLPGGSRLDVALKCNTLGLYNVSFAGQFVAVFNVTSGNLTTATPFAGGTAQWTPFRPPYLADMRNESVGSNLTVIALNQTINGLRYSPSTPLRSVTYGSVEEWVIVGAKANPIRTTTFHMQVVNCPGYSPGEFYDTITATDINLECRVRLRFINFSGKFVTQSNGFNKAQQGARTWMNVTDGGALPSFSDVAQKVCS